jgi:sialate O-acetylesterase
MKSMILDRTHQTTIATSLALTCLAVSALAEMRMAGIFGDNMVLQRDMPARVWGWVEPGEEVAVDFAGQHKTAKADAQGAWRVALDAMPASNEPRTLTVVSAGVAGKTIALTNVLVGEVWVGSGQSNMGGGMSSLRTVAPADFTVAFPNMRFCTLSFLGAYRPKEDIAPLQWKACETNNIDYVSAPAFYFGRDLHRHLKVPIGLVIASIGGTPIEPWTPREVFEADPETRAVLSRWETQLTNAYPDAREKYDEYHAKWLQSTVDYYQKIYLPWQKDVAAAKAAGKAPPVLPPDPNRPPFNYHGPTTVYNGMIAPLTSLTVRGVIWYQGESGSGTGNPEIYRKLFTGMIPAWRQAWKLGDFPFLIVQLPYITPANTDPNERAEVATSREGQRMASAANPNTALAITIDTGDDTNLHPSNKDVVGARLALGARALAYGEKIVYCGPLVQAVEAAAGGVRVRFAHVGGGLASRGADGKLSDRASLKGFAMAGADGKYVWADATIAGDTVVLRSDEIPQPVSVRYGWANHPVCTLFNREGLPASPFQAAVLKK